MSRRLSTFGVIALALLLVCARGGAPGPAPHALGAFGHGPAVVLVHGLGSQATEWLPVARSLARDHRVVLVELPGHGLARMPNALTLDEAARSLDREIAEQGAEPVVLVGHSVGGLIALAEALRSPARVRALVLVETALRPQAGPQERVALFAALEHDFRGTLRATYEAFGRDSAQGARLWAQASTVDSGVMKAWIPLAVASDLSGRLRELRVPLLVVLSDRSWPRDEPWPACAESLGYAGATSVRAVRIAGSGHFVMLDEPALVAGAIRRFLRDSSVPVLASAYGR